MLYNPYTTGRRTNRSNAGNLYNGNTRLELAERKSQKTHCRKSSFLWASAWDGNLNWHSGHRTWCLGSVCARTGFNGQKLCVVLVTPEFGYSAKLEVKRTNEFGLPTPGEYQGRFGCRTWISCDQVKNPSILTTIVRDITAEYMQLHILRTFVCHRSLGKKELCKKWICCWLSSNQPNLPARELVFRSQLSTSANRLVHVALLHNSWLTCE